ncbi:hypothetical protein [Alloactinosynnema sp. L-07]|uniref:hypothetical protein n=1 Tax=Alloactinosynnema sp. L-07 TaxID=1653480 RepID=UPI00065EF180|nr:hypothetical protein [Alloactinosynnema sp. L-07]CRK57013.1 hypothetical protein [Alloactinosynnema sp. L-07]
MLITVIEVAGGTLLLSAFGATTIAAPVADAGSSLAGRITIRIIGRAATRSVARVAGGVAARIAAAVATPGGALMCMSANAAGAAGLAVAAAAERDWVFLLVEAVWALVALCRVFPLARRARRRDPRPSGPTIVDRLPADTAHPHAVDPATAMALRWQR